MGNCCDINNRALIKYSSSDSICDFSINKVTEWGRWWHFYIYVIIWSSVMSSHSEYYTSLLMFTLCIDRKHFMHTCKRATPCAEHMACARSQHNEKRLKQRQRGKSQLCDWKPQRPSNTHRLKSNIQAKKTNLIPSSRYIWRKWCHFKR